MSTSAVSPIAAALRAQLDLGALPSGPQAGQTIRAVVMAQLEEGLVRLAFAGGTLDAKTTTALTQGAAVDVAVHAETNAAGLGFTVVGQAASGARAAAPSAAAPQTDAAQRLQVTAAATQAAAPRQTGLGVLIADVAQALTMPTLPAALRQAAAPVIAQTLPTEAAPTPAQIKTALSQSGLFLEQRLAQPQAGAAPPAADMKAALLVLRQLAQAWSQSEAPTPAAKSPPAAPPADASLPASAAQPRAAAASPPPGTEPQPGQIARSSTAAPPPLPLNEGRPAMPSAATTALVAAQVAEDAQADQAAPQDPRNAASRPAQSQGQSQPSAPPPYRDGPVAAQSAAAPSLPPHADAGTVAQRLVQQAEGALARQELLQIASLPQPLAGAERPDQQTSRWMFEIPFASPQGPAVAQFEISRDGRGPGGGGSAKTEPTWRARFSIDIEPMGPVHAQVALVGQRAHVSLWAERESSLQRLRDNAPQLTQALAQAEWTAEVSLHSGAPHRPAALPGRLIDVAS